MINSVYKNGKVMSSRQRTATDKNSNKYKTTYEVKEGVYNKVVIRVVIDTDPEQVELQHHSLLRSKIVIIINQMMMNQIIVQKK